MSKEYKPRPVQRLPKHDSIPDGLSLEDPAKSLASLTLTESLAEATNIVVSQWSRTKEFNDLKRFGISPIRQVLFHGPPGNGKTTAAQWLSHKLDVPLYRMRCDGLVQAYLGRTGENIGRVLDWIERQPSSVVLLDEVEQLFPARGTGGNCGAELSSAMAIFWQRLDRWKGRHLFVFATNMIDKLDAALLSRIELKLLFDAPSIEQSRNVIEYWIETLHEYGADQWGPVLLDGLQKSEGGECPFLSFRDLWQVIQSHVVAAVVNRSNE